MSGKTHVLALALFVGLLSQSGTATAADGKVVVLHGLPVSAVAAVTQNERGSGITVYRGPSTVQPPKPVDASPATVINGTSVKIDNLEPVGNWFLDRSDGRLSIVHCYARQSIYVGGKRQIRCNARRL